MNPSFINLTDRDVEDNQGNKWVCPICDLRFEAGEFVMVLRERSQFVGVPTTLHVGCLKDALSKARPAKIDRQYNEVRRKLIRGSTPLRVYLDEAPSV